MKKISDGAWAVSGLIWWTARLLGMPAVASLERNQYLDDYLHEIKKGFESGRLKRRKRGGKWVWSWSDDVDLRMRGEGDPVAMWNQHWDGRWRLFCFDLPAKKAKTRQRLIRSLKRLGFGKLQGSVWISPREYEELDELMNSIEISPAELSIFSAETIKGQPDDEIAQYAWKWDQIGERYQNYMEGLQRLSMKQRDKLSVAEATVLIREDASHWLQAVQGDPLLPQPFESEGYQGKEAWELREQYIRGTLKSAGIE